MSDYKKENMTRRNIHFPDDLWEAIEKFAADLSKKGQTVYSSEIIRKACIDLLKKEKRWK